jgi:hypothetical protein
MDAVVTLVQDDAQTSSNSVTMNGETVVTIDLSSMSPGPFTVRINAQGNGMADFSHTYDLSMSKESTPPSVTVSDGFWNGDSYELSGFVNDPDGDQVTLSGMNGEYNWGTFQIQGNNWLGWGSGIPDADANELTITACDNWNQCTSVMHSAGETPGDSDPNPPAPVDNGGDDGGGGLPGFGLVAALGAIALAGIGQQRRE